MDLKIVMVCPGSIITYVWHIHNMFSHDCVELAHNQLDNATHCTLDSFMYFVSFSPVFQLISLFEISLYENKVTLVRVVPLRINQRWRYQQQVFIQIVSEAPLEPSHHSRVNARIVHLLKSTIDLSMLFKGSTVHHRHAITKPLIMLSIPHLLGSTCLTLSMFRERLWITPRLILGVFTCIVTKTGYGTCNRWGHIYMCLNNTLVDIKRGININ